MRLHRGRTFLGAVFVAAGAMHFLRPGVYESIMPDWLPAHRELVYASGVAEAAGGLAVLAGRTAVPGGWWLIATLVGVFPANLHMALHPGRYPEIPEGLLWARLPLQGLLMGWVWAVAVRCRALRPTPPLRPPPAPSPPRRTARRPRGRGSRASRRA